jgi:formate-dependent nitrite reductase membrane component NrfD
VIKFLVYLGAAIPVFLFVRSVFFRRSTVVKSAASDFNKQIGYLAFGILILAALVLIYMLVHPLFAR